MVVRGEKDQVHLENGIEFCGEHHVSSRLQFACHKCLLAVELDGG
jgi:hypothetical protein